MAKYRFVEWLDEAGTVISKSNAIDLLVDRDVAITARYKIGTLPTPSPILFIAPLVVGAILTQIGKK